MHAPSLRRHWRGAALLAALALLMHVLALGGFGWAWPERAAQPRPAAAMQVRVLPGEARVAPAVADAGPPPEPQTQATPSPEPAAVPPKAAAMRTPVPTRAAREPRPVPAATAAPAEPLAQPLAERAAEPPATAPAEARGAEPSAPSSDDAIPLYATQMPPPVLLRYQVRRGALQGSGELLWRPQGDRYELLFDARVGPLNLLSQASAGAFDAAGIAPVRFTDQRARRPAQAVNFQREAGLVSFSGSGAALGLRAGMQDRLSWMVQLAAIVAAEPALRQVDGKVALIVVGAQGDASLWVFRCLGLRETADEGNPMNGTLAYLREPRDAYDTTVKVWLDPARHYLPARARLKAGPGDPGIALWLQDMQPLP